MRQIKFRAWTDEGMMPVTRVTFAGDVVYVYDSETDYEYQCEADKLMQFTGLLDKNGTEIFEGDVLAFTTDGMDKALRPGWHGVVDYITHAEEGDPYAGFVARNLIYKWSACEVIGNIYENGDLLK